MPLIAAAGENYGAVVKAEISIPRNAVIENNSVIECNDCPESSVNTEKSRKKRPLCPVGRKDGRKKLDEFIFNIQDCKNLRKSTKNHELQESVEQPGVPS